MRTNSRGSVLGKIADVIYSDTFYTVSPDDSDLWLELFMLADVVDPELAGILQWLRNTGTMLKPDDKFGYRLVPWVGDEGWSSEAEYRKESVALKPYRTQLVMILRKLGHEAYSCDIQECSGG